jgi:D-beta-D-heptose 7-phosphate kinase/D-beta-D-heptose 1-phosphate adenosyltransferase
MDFSQARILCLGDVILDRFAHCAIERISPEAPVPVLLVQRWRSSLGGAGNVARNIATLGGQAVLMRLLGRDAAGDEIRSLISEMPRLVDGHIESSGRPTICKTRYLAGHRQILRVDEESAHALDDGEQAALIAAIDKVIGSVDAASSRITAKASAVAKRCQRR